ncbi:MAG: cytochrome P450 [Pseudomonadota bacterium]
MTNAVSPLTDTSLFTPPRPKSLPPIAALARTVRQGDGDLLSLLPAAAYTMDAGELGYSRRSIKLFNDADLVREIMMDKDEIFPKSDLMVGALEPLIGNSVFVSDGPQWRRQRAMIDDAFSHMRLSVAFSSMQAAVDAYEARLDALAKTGEAFSLDLAMSHLTADIICRTVFSVSLDSDIAKEVFDDFTVFERGVAQVKIWRLITDRAFAKPRQDPDVLAACARIRRHLGELVDSHLGEGVGQYNDIAAAVIDARDKDTGEGFTREELIDQLGVFFLAGHETTASVLTWVFYILALRPEILAAVRTEVDTVAGDGEIAFDQVKKLVYIRSAFREALRLYPPITFMPRVAMKAGQIGKYKVRRGALIMIAPWTIHRRAAYWPNPDAFDPGRFSPEREKTIPQGAYIPFGLGPHTCVGAGFAAVESALIVARLAKRFDFSIEGDPSAVRPVARLTTRPAEQIMVRARAHGA